MKTIKTNQQLVNMKGEPLTNDENKPVFLGVVISNVLGGKTKNPSLGWILGKKFATEKTVDLLAEEVVFLKEEIKELGVRPDGWLSGLLCGQILDILDSKDEKDEKATDTY
jgi:hypothetical protein